MRLNKLISP